MKFERCYREWANRFCLVLLYAHLPILMGVAWWFGTGAISALIIGVMILAGPTALYLMNRSGMATSLSAACSTMGISGLLIHLGHGMIELHFHVFAAMAFLIVFGSIWPILAAAGTIAVHHLLFWWLLPQSVFNYKAGFGIVVVHAIFVIFETGPACWIAMRVGRAVKAQSITTGHLKAAAEHMLSAAKQVSSGGEELARCATEQAATLAETSASGTEVSATAQTTARSLESAVSCIGQVDTGMKNAGSVLNLLTSSMADISSSGDRISQMIGVINEIAMQTNILALNAAVESARAGEAGAGFAVVADEVRALAQRCAQAAKSSAELISESVQSSKAGGERVGQIATALHSVTDNAEQAKKLVVQANAGGHDQAKGVAMISTSLVHLEEITQRTAANAEENASVGQVLQTEAQRLMAIVNTLEELAAI